MPSRLHRNVTPVWSDENSNVALALAPVGTRSKNVSGGATTVHSERAGVSSTLSARSVARTRKTCVPGASPLYWAGESHEPHGSSSRAHSKVEPGSEDVKAKEARSLEVTAGGPSRIVVSGGPVSPGASTVHSWRAGVWSTVTSSRETARASSTCRPTVRSVIWYGFSQASNGCPSRAHSNVAGRSEPKWKVALMSVVVASGPARIVVSGSADSIPTCQVWVTHGVSTLRARSIARTRKTC